MKDDFFIPPPPPPKPENVILYAGHDFSHFNDEYFVITDGVDSLPHASEAEKITAETALWAYKVVRQKPFYWSEKLALLKRIFRTTNLTLWQKRRDKGFSGGLASALATLIVLTDYFWIGSTGNCNAFLYREGLIEVLTPQDVEDGMITKAAGFARKQLLPTMRSERLLQNDILMLATDGVANYVSEDQMRAVLETVDLTNESLQKAVDQFIQIAKNAGSQDKISLCIIKRIVL